MIPELYAGLIVLGCTCIVGVIAFLFQQLLGNIADDIREMKESALRSEKKADERDAYSDKRLGALERWQIRVDERLRIRNESGN